MLTIYVKKTQFYTNMNRTIEHKKECRENFKGFTTLLVPFIQ